MFHLSVRNKKCRPDRGSGKFMASAPVSGGLTSRRISLFDWSYNDESFYTRKSRGVTQCRTLKTSKIHQSQIRGPKSPAGFRWKTIEWRIIYSNPASVIPIKLDSATQMLHLRLKKRPPVLKISSGDKSSWICNTHGEVQPPPTLFFFVLFHFLPDIIEPSQRSYSHLDFRSHSLYFFENHRGIGPIRTLSVHIESFELWWEWNLVGEGAERDTSGGNTGQSGKTRIGQKSSNFVLGVQFGEGWEINKTWFQRTWLLELPSQIFTVCCLLNR